MLFAEPSLFAICSDGDNRIFVADAYTAYAMYLIASETPVPRPESTKEVKVFFPKFFEENYRKKQLEKHFLLMSPARIGMEEIRSNPSRYVMLFRPSMLDSDFGGNLPEGSRCLYSSWSGYLDRPDWQVVQDALAKVNGNLIEAHTSGHIFYDDIVDFVGQIKAKVVIPVHTFEPESFQRHFDNIQLLADGEELSVGSA